MIQRRRWFEVLAVIAVASAAVVVSNTFLQSTNSSGAATGPTTSPASTTAGPFPQRLVGNSTLFWLEGVGNGNEWHAFGGDQSTSVSIVKGTPATLRGWAIDPQTHKPAKSVAVLVDGRSYVIEPINENRPEVAATLKLSNANTCGFKFALATDTLPIGKHRVTFEAASSDDTGYYSVPSAFDLTVTQT